MNYQYETVEVSNGYDVGHTIQRYAQEGWRLHTIIKNNAISGGSVNRTDLNNSNINFYTNNMFVLVFEKKPVMEEIKDIMNDAL